MTNISPKSRCWLVWQLPPTTFLVKSTVSKLIIVLGWKLGIVISSGVAEPGSTTLADNGLPRRGNCNHSYIHAR